MIPYPWCLMSGNDYGKAVAKEIRDLAKDFESKPIKNPDVPQSAGVDPSVREQVIADLGNLADRREKGDLKP